MGSRAHYVVVTADGWELYYSHWGATTILRDLVWSPEIALAFIRSQAACSRDDWMDDVWCEAAALVDVHRRKLLVFGGERELAERRLWLGLMERTWANWGIRWADEGLGEVVDYLGVDRATVRGRRVPERVELGWDVLDGVDWSIAVVSLHTGGVLRVHQSPNSIDELLMVGPRLLELASDPHPAITLSSMPTGGAHIDLDRRSLLWWSEACVMDMPEAVARAWSDFAVTFTGHQYELQLAVVAGLVTVAAPGREETRSTLVEHLLSANETDSAALKAHLREELGPTVEFSPDFDLHALFRLPAEQRREILERALADMEGTS